MSNRLFVAFACNDPDNGHCRERFEMFNAVLRGGDTVELERGWPMTVRFLDAAKPGRKVTEIRVGRRKFSAVGPMTEWYGNWCWDAVEMSEYFAALLLEYLRENGFTICAGPADIYDAYSAGRAMTAEMLEASA